MALLFLEGFEESGTTSAEFNGGYPSIYKNNGVACTRLNYANVYTTSSRSRTAQNVITGKSLYAGGALVVYSLSSPGTVISGFGFNTTRETDNWICGFSQASSHAYTGNPSNGIRLTYNASGQLVLINNNSGSTLGTSSSSIAANTWVFIEVKVVAGSGTSGSCQVRVDGVDFLNLTGINTLATATALDEFYLQSKNSPVNYYDDLFICDGTGSANNDFLGPLNIYTLVPNGNSATVQMTASAGSNFQCVDEIPSNTTDYVTATAVNQTDLYTMTDLPAGITPTAIPGVQFRTQARRLSNNANLGKFQFASSYSGSTAFSTTKSVMASLFQSNFSIREKQPDGTSDWTKAAIDGLDAGMKSV